MTPMKIIIKILLVFMSSIVDIIFSPIILVHQKIYNKLFNKNCNNPFPLTTYLLSKLKNPTK